MNAKNIFAHVWDYIVLTFGIVIYCLSWTSFLIPNGIASGGGTGLCTIVYFATGVPVAVSFFILNAILLILGFLALGKAFGVKTIYAIILSTLLFDLFPKFDWVITFDNKLLIAVVGGILEALGIGLVLLRGGSTGGTDIAAQQILAGISWESLPFFRHIHNSVRASYPWKDIGGYDIRICGDGDILLYGGFRASGPEIIGPGADFLFKVQRDCR